MARFSCRNDNEPLMRLERPSTATSQTTAHIINSCFNQILSHKPLDSKDINNLAVSKREEDKDDYQDYYVQKLKRVSDECKQCLDELTQVERHLMQARAKALADDEKKLADLVKSCSTYKDIGLPQGPSHFRNYLDEELLAHHGLLIPSQYLPKQTTHSSPPKSADPPLFMQATASSSQHARVSIGKTRVSANIVSPRKVFKQSCPWQKCLTVPERVAEKDALLRLEKRTAYLKNPKYFSDFTNTASSGLLKQKKKLLLQENSWSPDSIVIEPSEVVFSVYQPGGTYQSLVEFKNVSGVSRQIRLIPVTSSYFSVSPGTFPTKDGLIAPGMQCSFKVTFTPDSLANYKESMKVLTNNGDCLVVPLIGMRPSPKLNLPSILDCGSCLIGDVKEWSISCENSGGEGRFRFMLGDIIDEDVIVEDTDSLSLGPFLVSPKEFELLPGESNDLHLTFTPPEIGWFSKDVSMACDNGQVLTFTLTGMAERVDVGCIHIRPSLDKEKFSFGPDTTPNNASVINASVPSISICEDVQVSDVLDTPCAEFDSVNPYHSSFQTILIHNFSKVNLPFEWRHYRPLTEGSHIEGQQESAGNLVPTINSPFFIYPKNGTLPAGQTSAFFIQFNPEKVGSFIDMGYFTIIYNIKSEALDSSSEGTKWIRHCDSSVSVVCIQMLGNCEPFVLELDPPAIIIPGLIPISTEIRKEFKIINHSVSTMCYQWNSYEMNGLSITVQPNNGKIVSGGNGHCELVVIGHSEGPFSSTLHCTSDGFINNFPLHVHGKIQGPVVSVSCGSVKFGLIQFGRSSSQTMCVSNKSMSSIDYSLKQLVQTERDGIMDHACLSFLPCEGKLPPCGSSSVTIKCHPEETGHLQSIMQLLVNGKPYQYISVEAEVQSPGLCLVSCQLHMKEAYVGIPCELSMLLRNNSLIPAHFTWRTKVLGSNSKCCKVNIRNMTGSVGPKEEMTVPLSVTWTAQGTVSNVFLECNVLDMEDSLFLSLSANVKSLSVIYRLLSTHSSTNENDDITSDEVPLPTTGTGYLLDFGQNNKLGQPVKLYVKVINTSAIPTSLKASVSHFPAAKLPTPLEKPKPGDSKYLLRKTSNIFKARHVTAEQEVADHVSSLLQDGRGICFVVEPSCSDLPAFGSVVMSITAYSDMWGEYTDQLTCQVDGLEKNEIIFINIGVVGCPIEFQPTATKSHTLIRFGSFPIGTKIIRRSIKMKNFGPNDIHVDWKVFNILKEDDKMVDLITFFGNPFPRFGNISASKTYEDKLDKVESIFDSSDDTVNVESKQNDEITETMDVSDVSKSIDETTNVDGNKTITVGSRDDTYAAMDGGETIDQLQQYFPSIAPPHNDDRFHIRMEVHEGEVVTYSPFSVYPGQMVIPAYGNATVEVTYVATEEILDTMGDTPCGYVLGHMNMDKQNIPYVTRKTGYDVNPLRINLMAGIEQLRLLLESGDDLTFQCPASLLLKDDMKVQPEAFQVHEFTLINPTLSVINFDFYTTSSHFFVTDVRTISPHLKVVAENSPKVLITIRPQCSIQFSMRFSFGPGDLLDMKRIQSSDDSSSECLFEAKLQIKFSTGSLQEFPLSAIVKFPVLTLSSTEFNMGTCLLGKTSTSRVIVSNISSSAAMWVSRVSSELEGVVIVSPKSGVLVPHLNEGKLSNQVIHFTFSPRLEVSYKGSVILTEVLTGQTWSLIISGNGSADEHHSRN